MAWFLLATALAAPAAAATERQPAGAAPLERLASTLDDLTAKLGAVRAEIAALRDRTAPAGTGKGPAGPLCALPAAQAQTLLALARALEDQRAGWRHAKAAMTGELIVLRERIAAADAAVSGLSRDREILVAHITELDELVQVAPGREPVGALAEEQPAAARHTLPATGFLHVTQPALAADALPALGPPGGMPVPRPANVLDLQAELALAQLRILELTTTVDTARLREEAMHAEIATLRDLTDSQIRRFVSR